MMLECADIHNAPDLLDLFFKVSIVVVRDHLRESDLLSGGLGEEEKGTG